MTNPSGQGYVTLATGAQRYVDMAVVLAPLSERRFDPEAPGVSAA